MRELTKRIREDMKPALGVTEPGAVAFAAAAARKHVAGEIRRVRVVLNSGMYKNAFTCGIPNSGHYGTSYAAALGAVAAKDELGLESLRDVTPEEDDEAARLVEEGRVEVCLGHMGPAIAIDAVAESEQDICTVQIRGSHTHITKIEKNGACIYEEAEKEAGQEEDVPFIHRCSFAEIMEYIEHVPAEEIAFIKDAFSMNMELLKEGTGSGRAVVARQLLAENGGQVLSEDAKKTAQLLCNGAIEARVLGLSKPAMSITGSGAHGIIATMPLYAWQQVEFKGEKEEVLLRATALSYLITMYIKEYSGKLSAFCGCGIAAGTGMACGLAYMRGAGREQLEMVIRNMASGITGMICDGGNHGCAMKGIVATDAGFRAAELALAGIAIEGMHGINGHTPEDTMRNMGRVASPGMVGTEETIVQIMGQK